MNVLESHSSTLCIIPCGAKKSIEQGEKAKKARGAYSSPFFKDTLSYAEKFHPDNYRILSTKYGLITGDTEIEWYEEKYFPAEVQTLMHSQIDQQELRKYTRIIALVSSGSFLEIVNKIFFHLEKNNICAPLNIFFKLNAQKWSPMCKAIRNCVDTGRPFDCHG